MFWIRIFKNYARLLVKIGINIQPNQTLVISSPVDCADFARLITEAAYEEGAREVVLNWNDDIVSSFATCMPRMRFSTSF